MYCQLSVVLKTRSFLHVELFQNLGCRKVFKKVSVKFLLEALHCFGDIANIAGSCLGVILNIRILRVNSKSKCDSNELRCILFVNVRIWLEE